MKISLIVATTENGVIGKNGAMPWSMPADLKYFREVTTMGECNAVLMGRKTYESIGRKLPERQNIVITRERDKTKISHIDAHVYNTIQDAIDQVRGWEYFLKKEYNLFIMGGASIYDEVMKMGIVEKIYHTLIYTNLDGDTFFSVPEDWRVLSEKPFLADENNPYDYTFRVLTTNQDLSSSQNLNLLSL